MSHMGLADPWGKCSDAVNNLFTRSKSGLMERDLGGNFTVIHVQENSPILNQVIDVIARGECGSSVRAPDPLLDWVYNGVRETGTYGPLPEEPSSDR
jgi:hypothetical protein